MFSFPRQFIKSQYSRCLKFLSKILCLLNDRHPSELDANDQDNKISNCHPPEFDAKGLSKELSNSTDQYTITQVKSSLHQVHFPPTEQQTEFAIQTFLGSINHNAVCSLASKYNRGQKCSIVKTDDKSYGSFNVCFFVYFQADSITLVVRIPILPVVRHAWDKVVSEVETIRYIKRNTTIPTPSIITHGKDDTLVEGSSTPFIIMDHIAGQQLCTKAFLYATKEQRMQLYTDLIGALAQLRQLQFTTGGSLMPNPENDYDPLVGRFLSMAANEFERSSGKTLVPKIFASTKDFIDYHSKILAGTYQLPVEELSQRDVKMELFALYGLSEDIVKHTDFTSSNDSFILTHPDLRFGNIFVDNKFHIIGIIDWEFVGTIPSQFFMPPPWITGDDLDIKRAIRGLVRQNNHLREGDILAEFREVLEQGSNIHTSWATLYRDWGFQQESGRADNWYLPSSPLAHILRHPLSLMEVYYSSIFRRIHGRTASPDEEVQKFFELPGNRLLTEQVELQVRISKLYTQYLRRKGLLASN